MRSGEVAAAAGVNLQTLRYYERRGLLAEPVRSPGGQRAYPAETVTVLRMIKTAQRLGFTLAEVSDLLGIAGSKPSSVDTGLKSRAAGKLADVEARIADLMTVRDTLRAAIDAGCDDLAECATTPYCPLPFDQPAEEISPT